MCVTGLHGSISICWSGQSRLFSEDKGPTDVTLRWSRTARSLALILFYSAVSSAAIYHVDTETGSDDMDGLTPTSAWKTLAKVNSTGFSPGDYVLLHRDQTWQERLIVSSSGKQDHPITYGAYGVGKP